MTTTPQWHLMSDISDWQPIVDMAAQARAGRRAIMIKASDGETTNGANTHRQRASQAHALNMRVLHYAFAQIGAEPAKAADTLLQASHPVWGAHDRLVVDVEAAGGLDAANAAGWLLAFQHRLDQRGAPLAWGYADEALLAEAGDELASLCHGWIVAAWDGGLLGRDRPKLPRGTGNRLMAKQFTDGQIGAQPRRSPGIGACDCSILTRQGLHDLAIAPPQMLRRPLRNRLPRRCGAA